MSLYFLFFAKGGLRSCACVYVPVHVACARVAAGVCKGEVGGSGAEVREAIGGSAKNPQYSHSAHSCLLPPRRPVGVPAAPLS